MNRLEKVFQVQNYKALIPFLTIGYPSINSTMEMVPLLVQHGCDIIELGIPFSDPLADGATIQESSYLALKQGVTPKECIEVAARLRQKVEAPIVFLSYYNPVLAMGLKKFCHDAASAGVDGLLIPDLPCHEGEELETIAAEEGLGIIYMLAPNSPGYRIDMVADRSSGFIYLVSLSGVTGVRDALPPDLEKFVGRLSG